MIVWLFACLALLSVVWGLKFIQSSDWLTYRFKIEIIPELISNKANIIISIKKPLMILKHRVVSKFYQLIYYGCGGFN